MSVQKFVPLRILQRCSYRLRPSHGNRLRRWQGPLHIQDLEHPSMGQNNKIRNHRACRLRQYPNQRVRLAIHLHPYPTGTNCVLFQRMGLHARLQLQAQRCSSHQGR